MKIPVFAIRIALVVLFLAAMSVRTSSVGLLVSPYFKGESAMNYRHAMIAGEGRSLNQPTHKAAFPDGYTPARYRADGAEVATGAAYRAARYFSEVEGRRFVSRWIVLAFSLSVFFVYGFVARLWKCQVGGLLAAAFVAFSPPLVALTNGRTFTHDIFGALLVSMHLWLLLRARERPTPARGILAAAALFPVLATWEGGAYYAAAVAVAIALTPVTSHGKRTWLLAGHTAVVLLACATVPYLSAVRMFSAWPIMVTLGALAATIAGGSMKRRAGIFLGISVVLTVALAPVRAGVTEDAPTLSYIFYRLRFLLLPPTDPHGLPDTIRNLWTHERAAPSLHSLMIFFVPALFVFASAALDARRLREHGLTLRATAAIAGVGMIAFAIDRGALAFASLSCATLIGISGRDLFAGPFRPRLREGLVVAGGLVILLQTVFPSAPINPVYALARATGVLYRDTSQFLWVSTEDTERGLVRFVATKTSVKDPVLGRKDITALLLTFTGRTSVPLEGARSSRSGTRNAALSRLLYGSELEAYEAANKLGARYIVYSIDMLLDTTPYSPRYLAAVPPVTEESLAWSMHFTPESLTAFTLVYENDHYRVFRLTDPAHPAPVFLTDHPPVYQHDAFVRAGSDIATFRRASVHLVLMCRDAERFSAVGGYDDAIRKFNQCLVSAPKYTRARIGLAQTFIQMRRLDAARDMLMSVLVYAPDNALALYQSAYVLTELGETKRARSMLDLMATSTADAELLKRGRLLRTFIDQGLPLSGPAPADSLQ